MATIALVVTLIIIAFAGGYAVGRVTAKPKAITATREEKARIDRVILMLKDANRRAAEAIAVADATAAARGRLPRP